MLDVEISTKTHDPIEAVKFAERYLADFDSFRIRNKTVQTFEAFAKGFFLQNKHGYRKRLAAKMVFEEAKRQELISENPIKSGMEIAEECKTREPFNAIEMAKLFPADDEGNDWGRGGYFFSSY